MFIIKTFLPIILFVLIYLGTSLYYFFHGEPKAFYLLSPNVAILPSIILAWFLNKDTTSNRMKYFINGIRHPDIITMCCIFLLSGAFGCVTSKIGSVESTVNMILCMFPDKLLSIAVFATAGFLATSIGSSMGTISTLGPIVVGLSNKGAFSLALGMGILISGAMFGDNLSLISDTTIASVNSQSADPKKKFKINLKLSLIASIFTIIVLFFNKPQNEIISYGTYSFVLVIPYIVLVSLAIFGINVFIVLIVSLIFSGLIGFSFTNYTLFKFSQDIYKGFSINYDIMTLSLLVGGLTGLSNTNPIKLTKKLYSWLPKQSGEKSASLIIAIIVSVLDILLANNTVAILLSGDIVRSISNSYNISSHKTAAILDIFSCIFQGIIPYGAQILLAGSIASISPLEISTKVYYCYILCTISIFYILTNYQRNKS